MDGINPTLAFAALFFGLASHPHDARESLLKQPQTEQTQLAKANTGRSADDIDRNTPVDTALDFEFGLAEEATERLAWWDQPLVWDAFECPNFAIVEDDSRPALGPSAAAALDLDIDAFERIGAGVISEEYDANACANDLPEP